MIRTILITLITFFSFFTLSEGQTKTLYDFEVNDISGNHFPLSKLRGKKVLIVNTASRCGLTSQYEDLQKLYNQYKDQNFTIIGFPANNFMNQEPGTNEEIYAFCKREYNVSFPMMGKISVKGNNQHPLYQWLTKKTLNGVMDSKIQWNFQKYLIDEKGHFVKMISPKTSPLDESIITWIKKE